MKTTEIKSDLFWTGVVDWNLRDFHGYSTEKGSTYNAYIIRAAKTVLFDTVKKGFTSEFLDNIRLIIDPESIDYIVVNHAEMDHSGALPEIMEIVKPEKVFCTAPGKKALEAHFGVCDWPFEIIKDSDTVDLGGKTVRFIGTAMLHWPESMASFIPEDNILISNDIFGQHWATSERFDDEVDQGELFMQAAKYYANIFLPTSGAAKKLLAKLDDLGINPDMLLVDHGLIWRSKVDEIIAAYKRWSSGETNPAAIIIYDTMWESTLKMARAIAREIAGDGVSVKLYDLRYNHRSDIMTDILEAKAVILGSPVLGKTVLPKMAAMLSYMKALRPFDKIGAAFGSYGWSDTSVKHLTEALEEIKFEIIDPGVSAQYVPDQDDLSKCKNFGKRIKEEILKRC